MAHIVRPTSRYSACLKFINEGGLELSFAFDDSAGAMNHLGRVSMALYNGEDLLKTDGVWDDVEFLKMLADHLGYELVKKA